MSRALLPFSRIVSTQRRRYPDGSLIYRIFCLGSERVHGSVTMHVLVTQLAVV